MRVLHVSHTAAISGGEHSLLTLLRGMPSEVELGVACPEGALATAVRELGLPVHLIPATSASFRLHPWRTGRALVELGAAAAAVDRLAKRHGATVLHANSVRAGLITGGSGMLGGPPSAVHVRDVLPEGASSLAVKRALIARSAELIAISRYVAHAFSSGPGRAALTVIDNPVDQGRFDPAAYDVGQCRRLLCGGTGPLIGIVGQITPWKGHDTAIRALSPILAMHPGTKLVVVGEVKFADRGTRLDNGGFLRELRALVAGFGLSEDVLFLGERHDIPGVLRALDVLLVPSTVEPFGRTVAEAMTMATPVIATSVGGPPELLVHGVSGLLAPPRDPDAWTSAIDRVLSDPSAARRMALAARSTALGRFGTTRHVQAMLAVLASATGGGRSGPVGRSSEATRPAQGSALKPRH